MQPTEILMEEHRVIARVLVALETAAKNASLNQYISPDFFLKAADFIKGFADGCHHQKEEGVLFEALIAQGLSREMGPVAVMLAEHEQGRELTRTLHASATQMQTGDSNALLSVMQSALGYVALLRNHIHKEDRVLFPLADRIIPTEQNQAILDAFARMTKEETTQHYLALASELERTANG